MNDPVFLDSAAFLRVWQRVTGEAGITAAPAQPEPDAITAQLRECICAKAAGTAFYAALAQRVCAVRQPLGQIAAQERAQLRALQTEYLQEIALSAQLDAAADAVPMPLRETLRTMAQQDARHAQRVRTLLTGLIF